MKQPLVTIIMAVRNSEPWLATALDSILRQNFEDYQVVIVDGGSTDRSLEIARAYPKTQTLTQQGTGFMNAWNQALDATQSDFVAFLDSDDYWPDGKLADQVRYFASRPETDCVIGRLEFFLDTPAVALPPGFRASLLATSHVAYSPGAALIRRNVFQHLGKFEERWTVASDLEWFGRIKNGGHKVAVLDRIVLRKRIHSRNLSYATPKARYYEELTKLLKEAVDRNRGSKGPA